MFICFLKKRRLFFYYAFNEKVFKYYIILFSRAEVFNSFHMDIYNLQISNDPYPLSWDLGIVWKQLCCLNLGIFCIIAPVGDI